MRRACIQLFDFVQSLAERSKAKLTFDFCCFFIRRSVALLLCAEVNRPESLAVPYVFYVCIVELLLS